MGNVQTVKSLESYETAFKNSDSGSHDGADEGTQLDVPSPAHDFYFTNLVTQTAEEKLVFRGPVVEDIEIKPIRSSPWKVPMNLNLNFSAETLLKQDPPELPWAVPKMISPPIFISPPFLDKGQVPTSLKSEIPAVEVANESRENNTNGKSMVAGDLTINEAAATLPPVLGFSSGRFPDRSPLYPIGMVSLSTQLSELPTICSDGNHLTYQEQLEDQGTIGVNPTENQTLKAIDTSATSQGGSLSNMNFSILEALPNVTQPPDNVLIPLDGIRNTEQTAKSHSLFAPTSSALESTRGHSSTELPINTPGIIRQEAEDTHCLTKTNPIEDRSMSIPHSSPCVIQTKTQEETQVTSITCFSYADALKRSLNVAQQRGAPNTLGISKPLRKDEQGLTIQQKFNRCQKTTNVEKKAITKETSLGNERQNSAQVNSKNPEIDSSKKITKSWNPIEPSIPPFKITKAQPRFQWISTCNNPKDPWNMAKPQAFTPNNAIHICKRNEGKNKVQHTVHSGTTWSVAKNSSTWKPQEQANPHKFGDTKKDKVYQSYPIKRRNRPKVVNNTSPTSTLKEPVKNMAVVSAQPQDVGLQTPGSTLPEKPSRENYTLATNTLQYSVHTEKIDQISNCETPEQLPEVEPQLMAQSEITEDKEISAEEHGDTFDLSNSCSSDPHIKKTTQCPDSSDQIPDQSLVVLKNVTVSEPTIAVEVPDNDVGVEKDDPVPDVAPKHQSPGRWKDFYVDNACTMKCRCRHRPGKLPPNVVSWFSVSQNKLAEPLWVTTLKVASTLVAGTKLLLDHHSLHEPEMSSTAGNE